MEEIDLREAQLLQQQFPYNADELLYEQIHHLLMITHLFFHSRMLLDYQLDIGFVSQQKDKG